MASNYEVLAREIGEVLGSASLTALSHFSFLGPSRAQVEHSAAGKEVVAFLEHRGVFVAFGRD